MRRLGFLLLLLIGLVAGCNTGSGETAVPTPEPIDLLAQAAANAEAAETLRLSVERTGADYFFVTEFGTVLFDSLTGQYAAPDVIQARAKVELGKLALDLDLYAKGEAQYIMGVFTNMEWQATVFAPGFNPQSIIAGLKPALAALNDVKIVGEETLEDGTAVYHLTSTAAGEDVAALVVNIVEMTGQVTVDVYVDKAQSLPLKFVIVQPDTVTAEQPEPTTWTIELYDFGAEAELNGPAGV